MTAARSSGLQTAARFLAVAFAIAVVSYLVVTAQRRAQPGPVPAQVPSTPPPAEAPPAEVPPAEAPPQPFLHSSKSLVMDPQIFGPVQNAPAPAPKPDAYVGPVYLPSSKSGRPLPPSRQR